MLKFKKFLFIFGCSLALLMGCSNGNETDETKKENEIQNDNNYKGIFVVKYNYSASGSISSSRTVPYCQAI